MIPLYILGLLLRYGPQHGYQIKKLLGEQLEDFTQIKLPTVYYHLEKMEASGLISAHCDKEGDRPEKTVYHISPSGLKKFRELLTQTLQIKYRPTFDVDATFYFSDSLKNNELIESLTRHMNNIKKTLDYLEIHRNDTMEHITKDFEIPAAIIFDHHILHFKAELAWARQSLNRLKEVELHDENKNH